MELLSNTNAPWLRFMFLAVQAPQENCLFSQLSVCMVLAASLSQQKDLVTGKGRGSFADKAMKLWCPEYLKAEALCFFKLTNHYLQLPYFDISIGAQPRFTV